MIIDQALETTTMCLLFDSNIHTPKLWFSEQGRQTTFVHKTENFTKPRQCMVYKTIKGAGFCSLNQEFH